MSWQDIRRRVLPPIGDVSPHDTSAFGATDRPRGSTKPHRGVDFNYDVGPNGQTGINLTHPALRSPVNGIVTNAGEGTVGRIAIRDANGFSHEILHTHTRHAAVGDPVAAGQLIGTMGNTGVKRANIEAGAHHVHYQLRDPAGNIVNPTDFWDQQGPASPDPYPPTYLGEYQQYLRGLGANTGDGFGNAPNAAIAPDLAGTGAPPARYLSSRIGPSDRQDSFDSRFGSWTSSATGITPRNPNLPAPPPEPNRPLGLFTGRPMPQWPVPHRSGIFRIVSERKTAPASTVSRRTQRDRRFRCSKNTFDA